MVAASSRSYPVDMRWPRTVDRSTSPAWLLRLRTFAERLRVALRRRVVLSRMETGDIVLASPRLRRLSPIALMYRLFLGSRYVHSMLYIGGDRMIHTTARHGVVVSRVPRKVFDRERYAIYRAPGLTRDERARIVSSALRSLDRKLDYAALVTNIPSRWFGVRHPLWRLERNRVWCSKLIADAYRVGAGVELVAEGRADTIVTEDFSASPALERV